MAGGLIALLDDVAALAKLAAASVDDIGAAAGRAGTKAAGVVVDDTAVTPRYVHGLRPERELPIIRRIAVGSLRNKLLFILPAALALSELLPWLLTPLLMLGGAYLSFEGAEKVSEALARRRNATPAHDSRAAGDAPVDAGAQEAAMVSGAIRTDFILSAEIMVIALNEVTDQPLLIRAAILVLVAIFITALVYGVVALIVKMDDVGLRLATNQQGASAGLGRALVTGMPRLLTVLATVGTAAMLWVGGHILLNGLHELGWSVPMDAVHDAGHAVSALGAAATWLAQTALGGILGLAVGFVIMRVLGPLLHRSDQGH
ncbi:MAG: DUF808 domain-containing protein [Actinobacteria bacterium]|nr:DUF808 domain-containing protein [Thermoleophilia bacterium]MCB9011878.1 DUF808 domain-containing protein [Actinomycetota bacterium]